MNFRSVPLPLLLVVLSLALTSCGTEEPNAGCTCVNSSNYDPGAQVDNGSCLGCTDPDADNYNACASINDGKCIVAVLGCTMSTAFNYDPNATQDNGSCIFPPDVVTGSITNVKENEVTIAGNIASTGNSSIFNKGIAWGTSQSPGGNLTVATSSTNDFAVTIIGLTAATQYFARAFATNSTGTSYGDDVTFTTRPISTELVHFNPVGSQANPENNPLSPSSAGSNISVGSLQNITHGFLSGSNTDKRPTLMGAGSLNVTNSFYVTFTITPFDADSGVFIESLTYTYRSYYIGATGTISLRTSADGFASTLDSKNWIGGSPSVISLTFDAGDMTVVKGPLEVRLYMHDLVGGDESFSGLPGDYPNPVDWADLVSTSAGGDGLRVIGGVTIPGF